MGDFYTSSQSKGLNSAANQKSVPGVATKSKGKRGKENQNQNSSKVDRLRFQPSRFYATKPHKSNASKTELLSSEKAGGDSDASAIATAEPQKAAKDAVKPCFVLLNRLPKDDKIGTKPCYVRLTRLPELEKSVAAPTRKNH